MIYPKRKQLRLNYYDYSSNGAYFITICTHNQKCLFGDVGADSISARMVKTTFLQTVKRYPTVTCDKFVIMPNHFHAILVISRADIESAPTISQVVQAFKRYSTLAYIKLVRHGMVPPFDQHVWQRSYHDHVIRNQKAYNKIWMYIDTNPLKWELDCYHADN